MVFMVLKEWSRNKHISNDTIWQGMGIFSISQMLEEEYQLKEHDDRIW